MHENAVDEILQYWFVDIEKSLWFKKDPDFDRELDQRFGCLLTLAKGDQLDNWCDTSRGRLALIIVLDQFSRNIHRGTSRSFEADPKALLLTVEGIANGSDQELSLAQRSFFYLPLRHAEDLAWRRPGSSMMRDTVRTSTR